MPRHSKIRLLRLPGFRFAGQQFLVGDVNSAEGRETTSKIYAALCGSSNFNLYPLDALREEIQSAVTLLFRLCIDASHQRDAGLINDSQAFQKVIDAWKPEEMGPTQVRLVLDAYVAARDLYIKQRVDDPDIPELAVLVDQYKTILGTTSEEEAAIWPPVEYSPEERLMFMDPRLVAKLRGVHGEKRRRIRHLSNKSPPLKMREYLSLLALSYSPADADIALYPIPVGFTDNTPQAQPSGENEELSTVSKFVDYARVMFEVHDRETVACLAMYNNLKYPRAVVIQTIGNDLTSGLRVIHAFPYDYGDSLLEAFNIQLREVFGNNIKEGWGGGHGDFEMNEPVGIMKWVCKFILEVVEDASLLKLCERLYIFENMTEFFQGGEQTMTLALRPRVPDPNVEMEEDDSIQ